MKYFLILLVFLSSCNVLRQSKSSNSEVPSENSVVEADYNFYFTEGTKFKLLNNSNQAINLFFKCISLKPNNAAPYYQLSEIYFNIGDFGRALAFSKQSVILDEKNTWYLLQLARIYQEKGNIDSTILTYQRIVKIKPSKYEVNFNLALLYFQNNEPKNTIQILNDLKHKYGNNEEIILTLFKVYSYTKNHRDCIKILKEAIKQFPEDVRFLGLLAEYYVNLGDFENALYYYNQLLQIDPDNEKCLLSLIEYHRIVKDYNRLNRLSYRYVSDSVFSYKSKIDVIANLIADQYILSKSSDTILLLIETLNSAYPNDFRVNTLYTDFYLKSKNYEQARNRLVYLVSNYKTTMPFWEQLVFVLSSLNDYNQILKYCNEGIEVFGNKPFFYLYKGISLFHLKLYKDAIIVLDDGLKYSGNSKDMLVQFYTYLGECSNASANYTQSDSFFQKALDLDPRNIYILNNYSFYLAERSANLSKAAEYIKVCLDIQPNSYSYLDTYGWVLYRMGKIENARKAVEAAIKNGGQKDKEILEHYVLILHKLGDIENARKYYKFVIELGEPRNEIKVLFQ